LEEVKAKEGALALVVRGNPKAKMFKGKAQETPTVSKISQVRAFLQGSGKVGAVWAKA
jgi:hypothetical protein